MNSCDLNLDLFTEEVFLLDYSSVYYLQYLKEIPDSYSTRWDDYSPFIHWPNYHPAVVLFNRRSTVPPSLIT